MSEIAIDAQGLNKWFGEGEAKTFAVRDVTFQAHFHEMLYIVGPSGSGKTTLLSTCSPISRRSRTSPFRSFSNVSTGKRRSLARRNTWRLSDSPTVRSLLRRDRRRDARRPHLRIRRPHSFHGGTLLHQKNAAVDARDAAFAMYKQTVLSAFEQVADTLRALQHDAEILRAYKEATDSAEQALHLLQTNYRSGIANYLQVIISNEQYVQAKLAYLQAVAQRLQDTVALYVALGGGWWNARI